MKVLVVGVGGVGGFFGGRLAKAGEVSVTFMGRGAHIQAIQERGLTVKGVDESFTIPVTAVSQPVLGDRFDLILFAVKSHDLEGAVEQTRQVLAPDGAAISLLNGVESEDVLVQCLGSDRVIGGIAFIGSRIESPGVILQTAKASLIIGELNGGKTDRIAAVQGIFERAGVPTRVTDQIRRELWRKLVWNAGFNPTCAITGLSAQEVLKIAPMRETVIRAMEEVIAVSEAIGFPLGREMVEKQISATEGAGEIIPSMLQDRRRGRPLEAEAISGVVVRGGSGAGVPTPVNQVLYALTTALNGRIGH